MITMRVYQPGSLSAIVVPEASLSCDVRLLHSINSESIMAGRRSFISRSTIVQFEIHPETGELKPTGQVTPSNTPVAMVFRPAG
jgi:hypothetical protein